jgi:hypothetical protein
MILIFVLNSIFYLMVCRLGICGRGLPFLSGPRRGLVRSKFHRNWAQVQNERAQKHSNDKGPKEHDLVNLVAVSWPWMDWKGSQNKEAEPLVSWKSLRTLLWHQKP